jgi:hypothetical protein
MFEVGYIFPDILYKYNEYTIDSPTIRRTYNMTFDVYSIHVDIENGT